MYGIYKNKCFSSYIFSKIFSTPFSLLLDRLFQEGFKSAGTCIFVTSHAYGDRTNPILLTLSKDCDTDVDANILVDQILVHCACT